MRKIIAIILLVAAAAGLVYGILGVTQKTVKVKSGSTVGVYSFEDNSFDGPMAWSSGGGIFAGFDDVKKLAHSQRSRQMWLGFGAFALLGIVVLTLPDQADGLVPVRFELVNDVKHIQGLRAENVFDR